MKRARQTFTTLVLVLIAMTASSCRQQPRGPDAVILLSIDTLRADHVGIYGLSPVETPHLDRLGHEGALFESVFAPFSRTTQSVGSMLTGLHPLRHGADGLGMQLPDRVLTLAESFRGAGYETAAFASNFFLRPGLGYEQGFDLYSNPESRWRGNSARSITSEALSWLEHRDDPSRPFFLWLHYLDPHWPYTPPDAEARAADPEWEGPFELFEKVLSREITKGEVVFFADRILSEREIERTLRLYAAEIAATDAAIGELIDGLERLGVWDRVWVFFTSDHGESTGDHRYWFAHGEYIYDDVLRVPWLVRAPGTVPPATTVSGSVRLEDLAPTLLELAGLRVEDGIDGISHAAALAAGGASEAPESTGIHLADHHLIHPENPRRPVPGREGRWWAVRSGGWKLLRVPLGESRFDEELYNFAEDPRESENLVEISPDEADRLRKLLERWRAGLEGAPQEGDGDEPEQDIDALRSLGYVN
jgi:arylsulfatase A-like enzyme